MRYLLAAVFAFALLAALPARSWGQSQIGDYLRRLDRNGDGMIDPRELDDRERSLLERFTSGTGLRLSEPIALDRLEYAARSYFERRQSDDRQSDDRRSDDNRSPGEIRSPGIPLSPVEGFGSLEGQPPLVRGFGLEETRYAFNEEDIEDAQRRMRSEDRNRDGAIDRLEARQTRWSEADPFVFDFDRDGRLSLHELTQRYAKRRLDDRDDDRDDDRRSDRPPPSQPPDARRDDNSRDERDDDQRRDERPESSDRPGRSDYYLAMCVIARYDLNRDGRLDREWREWKGLGENAAAADVDQDGHINRDELAAWLFVETQKRAGEVPPESLPAWFIDLDLDEDRQVSMAEFTTEWTDEKAEEFTQLDVNNDGFITRRELLSAEAKLAGTYAFQKASLLLPRTTLVTEIEVEDDYLIGDLDVQLSITHTNADQLDAFLIGPDGQRIELFASVGGDDDHFDATLLDDEAPESISRGRAPFQGSFQPTSLAKRQASLSHFYGQNVRGLWQLMIRTSRSDRSGMLHGWSLLVKPSALPQSAE
jgi:subtilisin-like proprotein convertase family protein/Ca2+-binding EF-hand superfamily protein